MDGIGVVLEDFDFLWDCVVEVVLNFDNVTQGQHTQSDLNSICPVTAGNIDVGFIFLQPLNQLYSIWEI